MAYDYKQIMEKNAEEAPEFARGLKEIREKRKKIVGREAGADVVGDISICRPTLGGAEFVQNFRILRMIGLKWNLSDLLGEKASDGVVYSIGVKLGRDLVSGRVIRGKNAKEFMADLTGFVERMKIGVISVVEWKDDFPNVLRLDECISCAGMLNVGQPVCHYEGGLIAGALSAHFKGLIVAREVLCWGHGEETCQFELRAK